MGEYRDVLVSVIIPVFNVEKYLKRCVDSVCGQTHKKLEIILVDDGSTDGCPALCDFFATQDSRIVVIHQHNQGLGMARNSGIDIAHGAWLCFVDSDDYIDSRFVEILLKAALDHDCLMAQCAYQMTHTDEMIFAQPKSEVKVMDWHNFAFFIAENEGFTLHSACTNIYHRSIFNSLRFDTYQCSEDVALVPILGYSVKKRPFAIVDHVLYYYYHRPESITRGKKSVGWLDHISAHRAIAMYWKEVEEPEMFDLCWRFYFSALINGFTVGRRDILGQEEKLAQLCDEIKSNLKKAKALCHEDLTIPVGGREAWARMLAPEKRFVMYGYGNIGMNILLPWLRFFNLPIIEVWDQRAVCGETIDGIPFCPAHDGLDKEVTILIAIGYAKPHLSYSIQAMLRGMGYRNFIRWPVLEAALKYAKYARFLPFLLEDNG